MFRFTNGAQYILYKVSDLKLNTNSFCPCKMASLYDFKLLIYLG